jgi:hypothetical protein
MQAYSTKVKELMCDIRQLEHELQVIASRIAAQPQLTVEEQQATRLAFEENGRLIQQLTQELLRLACI